MDAFSPKRRNYNTFPDQPVGLKLQHNHFSVIEMSQPYGVTNSVISHGKILLFHGQADSRQQIKGTQIAHLH